MQQNPSDTATARAQTPEAVTGVQLMQGIGHRPAQGFWADAWSQVMKRPGAVLGLTWIAIIAFFACFAPVLASGHPILWTKVGEPGSTTSPLWQNLTPVDVILLVAGVAAPLWVFLPMPLPRSRRLVILIFAGLLCALIVSLAIYLQSRVRSDSLPKAWLEAWNNKGASAEDPQGPRREFIRVATACIGVGSGLLFMLIPFTRRVWTRLIIVLLVAGFASCCIGLKWTPKLQSWPYHAQEAAGNYEATYTLIPWSPLQGDTAFNRVSPGKSPAQLRPEDPVLSTVEAHFILGSDENGRDVLTQMLHACRLSISIGLVSTGIAVILGVTIGSLMGYFGGWVDMVLYRVVEIFMSFPVLLLLIIAAGVLPRNTYVMMAIIGCFSWMTSARFIRAEFFKLRDQDFVQSARAVGLPLRSVLFRHMLPNGITPVLVDASFLIAAAINIEAILSFLSLGPADRPSWGALLSAATSQTGQFVWWLAIFPGFAIFLTVLAYNLIGEALRDAIDPKLKKARV